MLILFSTVILLVIAFGLYKRRQPKVHIPVMGLAFVMDIALVLYIEWTRHAIETFAESVAVPMDKTLLLFHIGVSLVTILLYVALIVSGIRLFRGDAAVRTWHRGLAGAFILFRLTNYATSFFINP